MSSVFDSKQALIIDLTVKQIIAGKLTSNDVLWIDADDVADEVKQHIKEGLSSVNTDEVASSLAVALDVDNPMDSTKLSEVLEDKKRVCNSQIKTFQFKLTHATRNLRRLELVSEVLSELGRLPDDDELI